MKCIILAAGYATRLYPLTENFPKPLLEVSGKPILDWLIDDMSQTGLIDEYIVISNHKFAPIFQTWASSKVEGTQSKGLSQRDSVEGTQSKGLSQRTPVEGTKSMGLSQRTPVEGTQTKGLSQRNSLRPNPLDLEPNALDLRPNPLDIKVLDDGTSSNETRLGAVRDIQFAIDQLNLDDDLLVMAGDNLLDFSLGDFIRYAKDKQATCVMRYYENDEARLHKTGVAEIDADGRILSMEEKPANPKSHWCIPAFYYYTREDTRLIKKGIDSGCGVDAPGSFIAWLATQTTVYTYEMPGRRYDIGTLASYEAVKNSFPPKK